MKLFDVRSHWERVWQSAMLMGVLGNGIRFGANLMLLPLVLDPRRLTSSELAMWAVFVTLGSFGNLADFGFGSTIPRIYSYLWAGADDFDAEGAPVSKPDGKPNIARIQQLNATVRSLYLKLSLAAMFLLAVAGTIYLVKPACESGYALKVWWLWGLFLIAIGYNLATSYWMMAAQGLNRVRDMEIAAVLSGLSYVGCAAILLLLGAGLSAMVAATFLKGIVMRQKCRQVCELIVPRPAEEVPPDPSIIRKLWPNAFKFGVLSVGGYLLMSCPILICRAFLGEKVTASFFLTSQVGVYAVSLASLWLTVKWPQIAILRTQGRLEEMASLFARRLGLVMVSFVALALVVFFAGNALLEWRGKNTRLLAPPFLAFYLIYLAQNIFYVQFGALAFTENVVPFFKIAIFTGIAACALSLTLTPWFGLWGLLISPLIAETICSNWYTVRRGFQGQPLTPRQFALAAVSGGA